MLHMIRACPWEATGEFGHMPNYTKIQYSRESNKYQEK